MTNIWKQTNKPLGPHSSSLCVSMSLHTLWSMGPQYIKINASLSYYYYKHRSFIANNKITSNCFLFYFIEKKNHLIKLCTIIH